MAQIANRSQTYDRDSANQAHRAKMTEEITAGGNSWININSTKDNVRVTEWVAQISSQ